MRKVKSYLVFTPLLYRIAVFVLLPIVVGVICALGDARKDIGNLIVMMIVLMVEIVADHWTFGGFYAKNAISMDYFKSSTKGNNLIKDAILMDQLRRLAEMILLMLLCYGIQHMLYLGKIDDGMEMNAFHYITLAFMLYVMTTFGIFLSRFSGAIWINVAITNILVLIVIFIYWITVTYSMFIIWGLIVAAGLLAILSWKVVKERVRCSYYD